MLTFYLFHFWSRDEQTPCARRLNNSNQEIQKAISQSNCILQQSDFRKIANGIGGVRATSVEFVKLRGSPTPPRHLYFLFYFFCNTLSESRFLLSLRLGKSRAHRKDISLDVSLLFTAAFGFWNSFSIHNGHHERVSEKIVSSSSKN